MKPSLRIDAELARSLFTYDAETGDLFWKYHPRYTTLAGKKITAVTNGGYLVVSWQDRLYRVHRICWLIFHGNLPDEI